MMKSEKDTFIYFIQHQDKDGSRMSHGQILGPIDNLSLVISEILVQKTISLYNVCQIASA